MSPALAAALNQSRNPCHPEAAESLARERLPTKDLCTWSLWTDAACTNEDEEPGAPFLAFCARSGIERDKNDYRGILAGLEGVSGKKAVDSETMTVRTKTDHVGQQLSCCSCTPANALFDGGSPYEPT